jgi:drug/metabolite transporter (DMT)-like permease
MPFLTLAASIGVVTGVFFHLARGGSFAQLVRLPRLVAVAGFFGVALYTLLLTAAMGLADEQDLGQIVLINYLWPVWIVLLSALLLDDRPRLWPMLLALVLGFAGVAVSRGSETFTRPAGSLLPHGLALVGAFSWALYSVLLRRWRVPEESCGSTASFFWCALIAAAAGGLTGAFRALPLISGWTVVWLLVYGIGAIGLGYPLWELGMKRGAAPLIAVVAYCIPLVAAGLMAAIFHRAASAGLIPGAVLIALGAVLATLAVRPSHDHLAEGTVPR